MFFSLPDLLHTSRSPARTWWGSDLNTMLTTPTMQQSRWARLRCGNKAPRPQGPKTTKVYFLFTLQVRRGGREALAPQGVPSGPRKRPGRWPWQRHTWPQKDTQVKTGHVTPSPSTRRPAASSLYCGLRRMGNQDFEPKAGMTPLMTPLSTRTTKTTHAGPPVPWMLG